jgi:hypothetical protein
MAWRIGAQEALERELAKLKGDAAALRDQLKWWDGYLRRVQGLKPDRPTPPGNGTTPGDGSNVPPQPPVPGVPPNPPVPGQPHPPGREDRPSGLIWGWALAGAGAASALAAVWSLLRRRRKTDGL